MIVNNEHREDLIKIAKKLIRKPHSIPTDENDEPTETYIEYLSLMYNPEMAKIVQVLPVFPEGINITEFANQVNIDKHQVKMGRSRGNANWILQSQVYSVRIRCQIFPAAK